MRLFSVALLVVLVSACARKDASVAAPAKAAAPAPSTAADAAGAPRAFADVSGVVEETLDASDYTYLRLKTAQGEVWAAINKSAVKKGERVTVVNAMPMDGFESRTLNRKFDRIVFGTLGGPGTATSAANAPGFPRPPRPWRPDTSPPTRRRPGSRWRPSTPPLRPAPRTSDRST